MPSLQKERFFYAMRRGFFIDYGEAREWPVRQLVAGVERRRQDDNTMSTAAGTVERCLGGPRGIRAGPGSARLRIALADGYQQDQHHAQHHPVDDEHRRAG